VFLKTDFEKKNIKLLINDIQGRDYLIDKMGFLNKSPEEQADLLKPYIQTTALINEMVNLEYEVRNGFVKIKEVGRNRKDRYSSLAYCNYFARQLEAKLKKQGKAINPHNFILMRKANVYAHR
jgi:tRNA isopentenyl-2-thiomethyl-A-37 hydroxylase MiaE